MLETKRRKLLVWWLLGVLSIMLLLGNYIPRPTRFFPLGMPLTAYTIESEYSTVRFWALASDSAMEQFYLSRVAAVLQRKNYHVLKREPSLTAIIILPPSEHLDWSQSQLQIRSQSIAGGLGGQMFEITVGPCEPDCATVDIGF